MVKMADDTASCPNARITTCSVVVIVGVLSIVANSIAITKSGHSRVKKNTVVSLKILCGASIVQATMTTVCTCLATFTCSLDNTVACVLQGALQRMVRVVVHLSFTMFFKNSLFPTVTHHPSRSVVKIVQRVLTTTWIIIGVMSGLPLFASTSYLFYPSLFACDIADVNVLVTSDSVVFCMPALAVLAMGLWKMTSGPSHSFEHRISYVVSSNRMNMQPHEYLQKMKRVAEAGMIISAALFLEWAVRIAAVLGIDNSSKYLLTLSLFFMLTCALCAPSCLVLVSRFPAVHIFSQEGYGSRRCSGQDNFTFSPHVANLQSVPSSPEVNLRPADLRLNGDLYRRCAMHAQSGHDLQNTPPGQDLPNTHPRGDLRNSSLTWGHPNGRDLRMTPLELDLLHTPPGRHRQNTPPGRDLTSTPLGRDLTSTRPGQDLTSTRPGRDLTSTPPERDLTSTRRGRDFTSTPPERDLTSTPPGRDLTSTPPGRDLTSSSPGRDLTSTPHGRGVTSYCRSPELALKRNSVSCQFSVGSWIRNEQRRTSSAWRRVQNNTMSRSCPDVNEVLEETGTCHSAEARSVISGLLELSS